VSDIDWQFQFEAIVRSKSSADGDYDYKVTIELANIVVYAYTPRTRLPYDPDYIDEIVAEAKQAFAARLFQVIQG
jgi:hypothetical protein